MLSEIAPDLFTEAIPHAMLGLQFGARMDVVRLPDGGIVVYSPLPLEPQRQASVAQLGPVRAIVAPNLMHHLYAGDWKAAFPEAQLYGAEGLEKKRKDLRFDGLLRPGAPAPWGGEALSLHAFAGHDRMRECALVHRPSGTLLCCDLVSNMPDSGHWVTSLYQGLMGFRGKPAFSRLLRTTFTDRPAARRSLEALLEEPFQRVVMAHGEVIGENGPEILREVHGWL